MLIFYVRAKYNQLAAYNRFWLFLNSYNFRLPHQAPAPASWTTVPGLPASWSPWRPWTSSAPACQRTPWQRGTGVTSPTHEDHASEYTYTYRISNCKIQLRVFASIITRKKACHFFSITFFYIKIATGWELPTDTCNLAFYSSRHMKLHHPSIIVQFFCNSFFIGHMYN